MEKGVVVGLSLECKDLNRLGCAAGPAGKKEGKAIGRGLGRIRPLRRDARCFWEDRLQGAARVAGAQEIRNREKPKKKGFRGATLKALFQNFSSEEGYVFLSMERAKVE